MAIYKGSRYEYSTIDFLYRSAEAEATPIVFYDIASLGTLSYKEHTYVAGERLDQISTQYYGTPKKWWLIVEANPELINFINIPAGRVIRIPNA